MIELVFAALFLLAFHVGISSSALRSTIVVRLGVAAYLAAYSILALAAFAWLIVAYGRAPLLPLWQQTPWQAWMVHRGHAACLPAADRRHDHGQPDPGRASVRQKTVEPPSGVLRITRHPTMWAFGLFAIAHLFVNGDAVSLILFATIALLALVGTSLIDARLSCSLRTVLAGPCRANLEHSAGGRHRWSPAAGFW